METDSGDSNLRQRNVPSISTENDINSYQNLPSTVKKMSIKLYVHNFEFKWRNFKYLAKTRFCRWCDMHHSFYAVSFFVDIEKGRVLRRLIFLSISHCMICCQRGNCVESNNMHNTRHPALSKQ